MLPVEGIELSTDTAIRVFQTYWRGLKRSIVPISDCGRLEISPRIWVKRHLAFVPFLAQLLPGHNHTVENAL